MPGETHSLSDIFSAERTVMSARRTLMSWVRTALSLISFGFTIYKFLEATTGDTPLGLLKLQNPRRIGLTLIALGTLSVLMGTIEYFETIKFLNELSARKYKAMNYSLFLGLMIGLLGLFLFVTILTHTEVF